MPALATETVEIVAFTGATSTPSFVLRGGAYGIIKVANATTGENNGGLYVLAADGSTWVNTNTLTGTAVYAVKSAARGDYSFQGLGSGNTYSLTVTRLDTPSSRITNAGAG